MQRAPLTDNDFTTDPYDVRHGDGSVGCLGDGLCTNGDWTFVELSGDQTAVVMSHFRL